MNVPERLYMTVRCHVRYQTICSENWSPFSVRKHTITHQWPPSTCPTITMSVAGIIIKHLSKRLGSANHLKDPSWVFQLVARPSMHHLIWWLFFILEQIPTAILFTHETWKKKHRIRLLIFKNTPKTTWSQSQERRNPLLPTLLVIRFIYW